MRAGFEGVPSVRAVDAPTVVPGVVPGVVPDVAEAAPADPPRASSRSGARNGRPSQAEKPAPTNQFRRSRAPDPTATIRPR